MSKITNFFAGLGLVAWAAWIGLIFAGLYGWFLNIFVIIGMIGGPVNTEFVVRIIGIPIGILGAIMGWIG